MSYAKYPKEMKEAVVSRIMSGEETISDIGINTGININTLYICSPEKRNVSNYQVQEC
jgi:transposase